MNSENFNPSYVGPRADVQTLISPEAKVILDVGCSTGSLGAAIKKQMGIKVYGIERSPEMATVAASQIDKVFTGDVTDILSQGDLGDIKFDTIIFADILEHLIDPWDILKQAGQYLTPDGEIIASIPNICRMDTICNLIFKGYWPYRDSGIHDRTHLRFFTKKNIIELFQGAGLSITKIKTNYRFIDNSWKINRIAKFFAIPGLRKFIAFQYLIKAQITST